MKIITLVIALIFMSFKIMAANLEITIDTIDDNKGNIMVAVYGEESSDNFVEDSPIKGISIPAQEGEVSLNVSLPAGNYAIAAYQDKNLNNKMDRYFFGKPKEPYGFSNDARRAFSAPKFEEAKFSLPEEGKSIVFSIR
jgi:uncharacterized protein (DUF2141 family)